MHYIVLHLHTVGRCAAVSFFCLHLKIQTAFGTTALSARAGLLKKTPTMRWRRTSMDPGPRNDWELCWCRSYTSSSPTRSCPSGSTHGTKNRCLDESAVLSRDRIKHPIQNNLVTSTASPGIEGLRPGAPEGAGMRPQLPACERPDSDYTASHSSDRVSIRRVCPRTALSIALAHRCACKHDSRNGSPWRQQLGEEAPA